jgi:hypothetical protein
VLESLDKKIEDSFRQGLQNHSFGIRFILDVNFGNTQDGLPEPQKEYFLGTMQAVFEFKGRAVSRPKLIRLYRHVPFN